MHSYISCINSTNNKMSQLSRRIFTLLGLTIAYLTTAVAQSGVDITQLVADTKTFAFDDKETTVKGYIYAQMDKETACCGSDRIYLEVRIHPSGYVIDAKTLTGKNDCFKSSAIDIVKNIKWDAEDFKGTKPVYFEIRPDINCSGNKSNEYSQIAIVNNELLDENGDPKDPEAGKTIYLGDAGGEQEASQGETSEEDLASSESTDATNTNEEMTEMEKPDNAEETESQTVMEDEETEGNNVDENPEEEEIDESGNDEKVAENETSEPASNEEEMPSQTIADASNDSEPVTEPESTNAENTQDKSSNSQPILIAANESNDGPVNDVAESVEEMGARESVATVDTPPTTAERQETEEEKARKDAEIQQLQTQLEELRAKEEALQDREKRRQEYQQRRREALEERRRQMQQQQNEQEDPFQNQNEEDPFSGEGDEGTTASMGEQDRNQEELDKLSQELSEIESRKRELQESRKRDAEEIRSFIQNRLRIEEEIRRKEEEITRNREQEELDRMAEDMRKLEDDKRELEGEMQRLMDEIQRLQDEMNKKVAELERQEMEIQRLNTNLAQRENEINRQRALREQQLNQELAMKEQQANLEMMGLTGASVPSTTRNPSTPMINIDPRLLQEADTSAAARQYVNQIMQMQEQIQYYQNQLQNMQSPNTVPGTQSYGTTQPGGVSSTTGIPGDAKRADQDQSWQNIDYNAPSGQSSPAQGNVGVRRPTGQAGTGYDPVYGYSPDTSHASTYKNVAGPRFTNLQYGTGSEAMNRYISDQLRNNGICGGVKAFAELTVNGQGQVIKVRPVKANTTQVLITLPAVLNGLTFMPTYSNIPQRINLEFETNIRCGGTTGPTTGGQFSPSLSNPTSN